MSEPEIGNWQRFLVREGFGDASGRALTIDEAWGERTSFATRAFQRSAGRLETGVLDDATRASGVKVGFVPFVQARSFTSFYPNRRVIDRVVVHTMEAAEKPGTALAVALWFASAHGPAASAHYCIDERDTIQCVRDVDVAWACGVDNPHSVSLEHAGYAAQSPAEWASPANERMLERSAVVAAGLARAYGIPVRRLSDDALRAGAKGFVGHVDINRALANGHGHTDPGLNFPWDHYLLLVTAVLDTTEEVS